MALDAATNFQLDAAHFEAARRPVAGVVVASPANPTGSMLAPDALASLVAAARDERIRLISDEIYHGITYAEPAATALAFGDEPIVVNSFSKYFSMTGWRLGWLIVPDSLVRPIDPRPEPLYRADESVAARGPCRLRCGRRTRCQRRPLCRQPPTAARRPAAARPWRHRPRRRRLLPLRRHRPPER